MPQGYWKKLGYFRTLFTTSALEKSIVLRVLTVEIDVRQYMTTLCLLTAPVTDTLSGNVSDCWMKDNMLTSVTSE